MSHSTEIKEGKFKLVVIHNGDWSGDAEVVVFSDSISPSHPIARFTIPGTMIARLAVVIVSVGVERFLSSTVERVFSDKGPLLKWILR